MIVGYKIDIGNIKGQMEFQDWFKNYRDSYYIKITNIVATITGEVIYMVESESAQAWEALNEFYLGLIQYESTN